MRATSIIFRREMASYLRSPVGYLVAALVLLVVGVVFYSQALGSGRKLSAQVMFHFFQYAHGIYMVAAIALSFRLIAEERQQRTIVLLNTSPVRDSEIVIGKFLAALVFLTIMILLSIYMPLLILVNGKISVSQLIVGYIGLILLGGATLAIGMFATAVSNHQIVALMVGATIAGVMWLMYLLAIKLNPPLKEVLAQLAMFHGHFQAGFAKGILNLKDVVYYLAVIYFFLLLAVKTSEAKRWQ